MDRRTRAAIAAQPMQRRSHVVGYLVGAALALGSIGAVAALAGYVPGFEGNAGAEAPTDLSSGTAPASPLCRMCGRIENIQRLGFGGSEVGVGGFAGGVAGALAGRQLGAGEGGLLLAVVGAATGAHAGSRVAESVGQTIGWRIFVRMDDGGLRRVDQKDAPALVVGDRVRLVHGNVVAQS